VHVPDQGIVYTGDILFVDAHPVAWEGPVANWIAACDTILAWQPETVVPGHGSITEAGAVRGVRDYWVWLSEGARQAHEAGLCVHEAALDLSKAGYGHWREAERLAVNVATLFRQWDGTAIPDALESFAAMARLGEALHRH
jgi:cyclase